MFGGQSTETDDVILSSLAFILCCEWHLCDVAK